MEEQLNQHGTDNQQEREVAQHEMTVSSQDTAATAESSEDKGEELQTLKPTFKEIWTQESFNGKEHFKLKDSGELVIKDPHREKDRVIAHLTDESCVHTLDTLKRRFEECLSQFTTLSNDWESGEDKIRLYSRVNHFRKTINSVEAIGDFTAIWAAMEKIEAELKTILEENLKIKAAIVQKADDIKLKDETKRDDWDNLIQEWQKSPFVEREASDQLWAKLEQARNEYYTHQQELISERNKEQMQNLDLKMEICEKAEALAQSEDWHHATDTLKALFEQWKGIGYVPSQEKSNELWDRFQAAQNTFYTRKSEHYERIKKEQEENYDKKLKLVEQAESIQNQTSWKETTKAFEKIMDEWREIGWVPHEKSDELWSRLQTAKDTFFTARREHVEEFKSELEGNLAKKLDLVEQANKLKNSTDWRAATDEFNRLMDEWKTVGRIPREKSDEVWNHFLSARKQFFANKDAHRKERRDQFLNRINNRLDQTRHFLNELKDENFEDNAKLKDFRESLAATTGGSLKDVELRQHLSDLIRDLEKRIPNREKKIQKVEEQLKELQEKKEESATRKPKENKVDSGIEYKEKIVNPPDTEDQPNDAE